MRSLIQEYSIYARYFAPRGRERLLFLGEQISHRHLNFNDRLIGIVGDAGSGKSSLIKGMFPGLELSNDDDKMDPRKIMQIRELAEDLPEFVTFHIDMRFQTAFTQMGEIVEFVNNALSLKRRVIVEHFDLLYPALGRNADIIIGIGEEILVTRPNIFGPLPQNIYDIVHESLLFRKMAHTAEDITIQLLKDEFGVYDGMFYSSDVRGGFVLRFVNEAQFDLDRLAKRIDERVAENLQVSYYDEDHIMIGDKLIECNGPRLHVRNTSEIQNFALVRQLVKDNKTDTYCLIGLIGGDTEHISNLNKLHSFRKR